LITADERKGDALKVTENMVSECLRHD
jgi:hypothetical protein